MIISNAIHSVGGVFKHSALAVTGSIIGILYGGALCTHAYSERVDVRSSPKDKWQALETHTLDTMPDFKPGAPVKLSKYGGRLDKKEKATGFFRVANRDGRWWMVDPDGCLFISAGINTVSAPDSDVQKTAALLHENGFNTLGCWSNGELFRKYSVPFPYCLRWNFMLTYGNQRKQIYPGTGTSKVIYPFDPEFETFCEARSKELDATRNDPWLMGHFIDNELPLDEDNIVNNYLKFPISDPCHQAAAEFMKSRKGGKPQLGDNREFLKLVVSVYYRKVDFAPRPGSGRTNACWANAIQVSCCKGKFIVDDCKFSGMQDNTINVHGTYLRIVGRPAADQLHVRFCYSQTYGIEAFFDGDDIDFVHADSLRIFESGRVRKAEMMGERDMLLTLEKSTPEGIQANNVIENVTWTPEVSIRNCRIEMCSKRGFLLATRRKVLIENNTFNRTAMCAILVANDARRGFESGPVRDMTITGNQFVRCGIDISPESGDTKPEEPVHENIRIEGNVFDQAEITAKSVKRLIIVGNKWLSGPVQVRVKACMDVNNEDKKQEIRMLVE